MRINRHVFLFSFFSEEKRKQKVNTTNTQESYESQDQFLIYRRTETRHCFLFLKKKRHSKPRLLLNFTPFPKLKISLGY